jgi:Carbohydrate binding domain.
MFPFQPTHHAPSNITNVRTWSGVSNQSAGVNGFITSQGNHFVDENGHEMRFIGTNIGMTGCFPDHQAADQLAEELTRYGINIVRMHYVSHRTPKEGYPVLNSFIEPVQLERFDYLFAKLKERGIYIYFQLNIARKFGIVNGLPNANKLPYYKNGVDNVNERFIELQERFHREILNHVNPYTGIAYKDDRAISMMELANENSIVNAWFAPKYKFTALVEPYKSQFVEKWNTWLIEKYGNTENMKKAWLTNSDGDGTQQLPVAEMNPANGGWDLQLNSTSDASYRFKSASKELKGDYYARVQVKKTTKDLSNPRFYQKGISLKEGNTYCLKFKMRSNKPMSVIVRVSQAHAPWKSAGLQATAKCTEEWKEFKYNFTSSLSDKDIRVVLNNFYVGIIDIADVSLASGLDYTWPQSQSLEKMNVDWPYMYNWSAPLQRSYDFTAFLSDLEISYFTGLYKNTKSNLQIKQPVAGTQLGYGFNQPQALMDYCDIHGYWCHPAFPGGKWNNNHWNLRNGSIANSYGHPGSTFTKMARSRILGKPFTISEYDHPNLNFYCAEADLMMAAMGAFQNWSALMQFAWILDTDYNREHIWPMFDMCSAPQKLVHFPACYAMFVRGDVHKGDDRMVFAYSSSKQNDIKAVAKGKEVASIGYHSSGLLNSLPLALVSGTQVEESPELFSSDGRVVIRSEKDVPEEIKEAYNNKLMQSSTGEITWNWQKENAGFFMVDTRNTKVFSGFVSGRTFIYSGMRLIPGKTRLDWLTLSLTLTNPSASSKQRSLMRPGSYLLAATGLVHNTNAKIVALADQPGKISCSEPDGGNVGTSPVLCEGIDARLAFAGLKGRVKCYALDADGNRMQEVKVTSSEAGEAILDISAKYKTVWYEMIVEEKQNN